MKSILISVIFPAWVWAQRKRSALMGPQAKFLSVSYAKNLAVRDNVKCRRLIQSTWYQERWGNQVKIAGDQDEKIRYETTAGGYRIATSFDSQLTGDGGDYILVDDPHNVADGESEAVRERTANVFSEALSTRFNNQKTGVMILVMQRVHARDVTGMALAQGGWRHICLPMRFEPDHPHRYERDRRTEPGELLWKERFGEEEVRRLEMALGSYATAGQLQQRPAPREGGMFKRTWFEVVPAAPAGGKTVRRWDLAASEPGTSRDPDWTVGLRMKKSPEGVFYIEAVERLRETPMHVERAITTTASQDGHGVEIVLPQDPGQAGKSQAQYLISKLAGYIAKALPETGDKVTRASPFAAQCEAGNVKLVAGAWNEPFLEELSMFPNGPHDDQVDAAAGAFQHLIGGKRSQVLVF